MKYVRYNRNGGTTEHTTTSYEKRKRVGKTAKDKRRKNV